ncbi:MAG TPA: hypothetical protein VLB73_03755, partial [Patescibacteria group bacterium]|nr:hypothetical protein [Patescibacteria group bacterium]
MRVPTRLPRRYTRSLRGQAQADPDETFRRGMDSFADRDSVATTEDVYRSVSGYDPRAKAEELARAGDTIDVWAQIGV